MHYIGAHVSTSGGVQNAPLNARAIGAKAFALFTKNQRQWLVKPLETAAIEGFKRNCSDNGFDLKHVLAHDGYLINIGNSDPAKREHSWTAFLDEVRRCELLGVPLLNMHPGSHLKMITEEECLALVSEGINRVLEKTKGVTVVIETTAGQGSNMGYTFEHLAAMVDKVEDKTRVGFCIDTCHVFAAGYDMRTAADVKKTLDRADKIIGLSYLRGMHLNDSKNDFKSKKDRHESLGKGFIGIECFKAIMNEKRLADIPLILETPDEEKWGEEIAMLYGFQKK